MAIEMLEAMYALDTKAYDLYEKGIKTIIGWKRDNILLTVTPIDGDCIFLPTQTLAIINSMYEYYEYTGNIEFLQYVYPHVKEFLKAWKVNEKTGLLDMEKLDWLPVWEWGDSVAECDYKAIENAWIYLALNRTYQMADVLGYEQDKIELKQRLDNLKMSYNQLWTLQGYKSANSKMIDERANALAVISGLAEQDKYETIANLLTNSYDATVYMEKYVLEALCEMGKIEEAQKRIRDRYQEMVTGEKSCSTLWENWNYEIGTKNHAWAGGPMIIMSKYFAGIEPFEKGYDVISIKPQFGNLKKMVSKVATVKGEVSLHAKKEENSIYLKVNVPAKARVAVEKVKENCEILANGKTVYKKGKEKKHKQVQYDAEDEKYIYFYVEPGEYEFETR